MLPFAAFAEQVTISSPDGATSIVGELLSFDDDTYVLETSIGELRLSREWTTCEGAGCPIVASDLELSIAANAANTSQLLQKLVGGFVSTKGLSGAPTEQSSDTQTRIELADSTGANAAGTVDINVQPIEAGFEQLGAGSVDMFLSTTLVPAAIAEANIANGQVDLRDEARERVIALDAVVPIVHPDNPVRSVSLENLAQIAGGRITNWAELGGDDAPIRMLLPAEGSSLDQALGELVLEPNRIRLRRTAERAESESQAAAAVVEDVNAITVTSLSGRGGGEVLPIRQSCGPLAYASDFAIKAEEYPLSQRVYAYTADEKQEPFKAGFVDYMSSKEAQPLIEELGFVGQTIVTQPVSLQGTRMTSAILSAASADTLGVVQTFARDLATADRLSTTFRFTSASSDLDTKSRTDLERMVAYLNSEEAANREILVIGFSDNVGRYDLNERLALLRATSVKDALIAVPGGGALTDRITTSAYGPLAPVGCNDTANGRESNRRVEVWLR
ncbi:phosphate ABC transporter substrate-binding/OmpA family protein [Sulfitobacter donghicola]|nr:phosphate ABC transporter substrate-binding/OmpA family protein [Sulfitobacter donghicola]